MINHTRIGWKEVDGVSHWENLKSSSVSSSAVRTELLVNIDYDYIRAYSPDPVRYEPYPNPYFNTTVQAGLILIVNETKWKIMTADPG